MTIRGSFGGSGASDAALAAETAARETADALLLAKAGNLSDVASAATARNNLGLGTAAVTAAAAYATAAQGATADAAAAAVAGLAAVAASGSAADLSTGILPDARMPDLTGDVTTAEGAVATTIANNAVTNAKAAQMAANTIKGNNTGSTANAGDLTVAQVLTMLGLNHICQGRLTLAPGYPVYSPGNSVAASGQDTTAETVTLTAHGWVTGTMVVSSATSGGLTAATQYYVNAASANAVSFHTTVAAAEAGTSKVDITGTVTATITASGISRTSVRFSPYQGNRVALYNGSTWDILAFSETDLALGTLTAGKNYDVFAYNNSGTLALELSAAWASDTAQTDALALQDGVLVKSGATTRRYLGTIRTNSTTTTIDNAGGVISQVGGKRFVWNLYHRVARPLSVMDTGNWAYTTQTWRQANGASGNKVEYVCGPDGAPLVRGVLTVSIHAQSNTADEGVATIALDTTSAIAGGSVGGFYNATTSVLIGEGISHYAKPSPPGYHYLSWNEYGGNGTCNFRGSNAQTTCRMDCWIDC